MDNDLMSSLMGILNDPDTKDKLSKLISSSDSASEQKTAKAPPPALPDSPLFTDNGMDIMFKVKNMMDRLNRNDDYRIGLLNSIRPFLKNGREKNIDTAINFIRILNFATGR